VRETLRKEHHPLWRVRSNIGMDVHKEATTIAVLDPSGRLVMESIVETKAATIVQLVQGLRGDLHVTFEEGTWAAWLYDLLKPYVTKVVVCDPRRMPCCNREIRVTGSMHESWRNCSALDLCQGSIMARSVCVR